MNTARSRHTATLLPGGQVLLAAGYGGGGDQSSAELYDSSAGTWAATGGLNSRHGLHTATLLANGQVLLTGGDTGTNGFSSATELYCFDERDVGDNRADESPNATRHTATLLVNGQVLAAGGYEQHCPPLSTAPNCTIRPLGPGR